MAGGFRTGVTLQTLDEKAFDHGTILAQTPPRGLKIPGGMSCTYDDLLQFIKPKAAEMLVNGLRDRLFVPPLVDVGKFDCKQPQRAPKITKEDTRITGRHWQNAAAIHSRHRALGRLWATLKFGDGNAKRVIFEDFELLPLSAIPDDAYVWVPEVLKPVGNVQKSRWEKRGSKGEDAIYIRCMDHALRVSQITIEGKKKKAASKMALMDPET